MEFTKPEPTPANPLGALVVCHEDHSMTIVDEEAAEVAFTRRPLGRIFIATPQTLGHGKAAEILSSIAKQHGFTFAAAHHHRAWVPVGRFGAGGMGMSLMVVATPPWKKPHSRYENLTQDIRRRGFGVAAEQLIHPGEHSLYRGELEKALDLRDCSHMRLYLPLLQTGALSGVELVACDKADTLLGLVSGHIWNYIDRNDTAHLNSRSFAPLLREVAARQDSIEAALVANVLESTMTTRHMVDVIDDIRQGKLTTPA